MPGSRLSSADLVPRQLGFNAPLPLVVCLLLTFLGALGITFSTLFSNVLVAVLGLLLVVLLSGFVLQFLGLTWMSTTAVVYGLPETFRGNTPVWDLVRIFLVFTSLTAARLNGSAAKPYRVSVGRQVTGFETMPASERLTRSTCAA